MSAPLKINCKKMKVPNHLVLIPDGNRRWAKKRGLRPWLGHKQGFALLTELCEAAISQGVVYTTFWAASIDNLTKRDKLEVKFLLKIIKDELSKPDFLEFLHKNKIQIKVLGEWERVVKDLSLAKTLHNIQQQTKNYNQSFLTILFAYDGKREMLGAINNAKKTAGEISEKLLRENLLTGHLPDVDFVIRTGGQPHWSAGFMMWLTANSEFYFTETLWPDFGTAELKEALKDYAKRLRKMGR